MNKKNAIFNKITAEMMSRALLHGEIFEILPKPKEGCRYIVNLDGSISCIPITPDEKENPDNE